MTEAHPSESDSLDIVNHPPHYTSHPSGVECITITEHYSFCLGNAIKYIWRAGVKSDDPIEDLRKAAWYVEREIARLSRPTGSDSIPEQAHPSDAHPQSPTLLNRFPVDELLADNDLVPNGFRFLGSRSGKLECVICGRRGWPYGSWIGTCQRGHAPAPCCGRLLVVKRDGSARSHPGPCGRGIVAVRDGREPFTAADANRVLGDVARSTVAEAVAKHDEPELYAASWD